IPYVITDGTATATANELISVSPANDAPVAVDDNYTVAEEGTVTLTPLSLDTDTDGDTLSITSINGTALTPGTAQVIAVTNGTVNITAAGVISFTPSANYNGSVSIPYVITDGTATATANELISVSPVDDPIVVNNDGLITVDGINGALEFINILDNDSLYQLPLNLQDIVVSYPTSLYFEFNSDGTVNAKPNIPGGNYSFTYQVCEKANPLNCASATLNVFVEVPAIAIIKTATFNDIDNSGYANAGETITYNFKVTNTGNVPLSEVTVTDLLPGIVLSGEPISLAVNESDEHTFTATYTILQSDINNKMVTNQASVTGVSAIGVTVEDKSDNDNDLEDNPTVTDLEGCVIKVFNAVSPNNDGDNDELYIRGIECYPDNIVEIYNRWGVLVFEKSHYDNIDNTFKGMSEGRTTIKKSEGLPTGTYFYILKYKDSDAKQHESSGYLYLSN
ncbi:hypothetical protein DMB65_17395, partial [Flavobacterium cheongpyeongense]